MPLVVYNRTKPWDYDAAEIALKNKISFFGYALHSSSSYDCRHLKTCVADPSGPEEAWKAAVANAKDIYRALGYPHPPNIRQANKNRNIVKDVKTGDIVLMPRPSLGVVYAAFVSKLGFELVDCPPWADDFRKLCGDNNKVRFPEIEVAQCWHVEDWTRIPFTSIPGWIRRSLFGQATYNRVHPVGELSPHVALSELMGNSRTASLQWTYESAQIEERLKHHLGPSAFEHLVVALLQLEQPSRRWFHVGGSGDGGADGLAADDNGNVVAVLQCKWSFDSLPKKFTDPLLGREPIEQIVAGLIYPVAPDLHKDIRFLGAKEISALVAKHKDRLPIALSLRIGQL
jgi:hypothetical protein